MNLAERILDKLQASPFSASEMIGDFGERTVSAGQLKVALASLLSAGLIVQLKTRRDHGPFYALPTYREPAGWLDHSDVTIGRDYSRQYDAPDWRSEA